MFIKINTENDGLHYMNTEVKAISIYEEKAIFSKITTTMREYKFLLIGDRRFIIPDEDTDKVITRLDVGFTNGKNMIDLTDVKIYRFF